MSIPYRADTLAAALVAALVLTAARRRPRPVVRRPRRCTHTPPIGSYVAADVSAPTTPVQPPVFAWCCEIWWLTSGRDHASYCPANC
ncbi:hypothetical protein [Streptomyces sp. NPDC002537]